VANEFWGIKDVIELIMKEEIYIRRDNLKENQFVDFSEKSYELLVGDNTDKLFAFKETSFRGLQVVRCDYDLNSDERISLDIKSDALEMHFRLSGNSTAVCDDGLQLHSNSGQHSLLYHHEGQKKIDMHQSKNPGSFLEIRASIAAVQDIFIQGNDFQKRFFEHLQKGRHYWEGYTLPITAQMYTVVQQLTSCTYSGMMKSFFMEAKIMELMLLQADAYANQNPNVQKIKSADIDKLYAVKNYLDLNKGAPASLEFLSKSMMIPTKNLTNGFKQLFNSTVLEYRIKVMMQQAVYLLEEEKLYVSEVSDRLGYANPQHFTTAFKKHFGYLPSALKA